VLLSLNSFHQGKLREVRRTGLLMDPDRMLSYCHSFLIGCGEVARSEELSGEELHLDAAMVFRT
jgi:hypothetical protein